MFFIETTGANSPEADKMEKLKLIAATIAGVMTLGLTGVGVTSAAANDGYSKKSRTSVSVTILSLIHI